MRPQPLPLFVHDDTGHRCSTTKPTRPDLPPRRKDAKERRFYHKGPKTPRNARGNSPTDGRAGPRMEARGTVARSFPDRTAVKSQPRKPRTQAKEGSGNEHRYDNDNRFAIASLTTSSVPSQRYDLGSAGRRSPASICWLPSSVFLFLVVVVVVVGFPVVRSRLRQQQPLNRLADSLTTTTRCSDCHDSVSQQSVRAVVRAAEPC